MQIIKTKSFELATYIQGKQSAKKTALILPGRLDTKDYPHMQSHVNYLAKKGYLAVSFDPPGTWESKGDIKDYTMTNYLKAINELIEYFGSKPTVLMGHSRGGSMAMLAGTKNDCVTHIVAIMSLASYAISKRAKKNGQEIAFREDPSGGKKKFILPLSFFTDAAKYNMLDALATCTKPKLYFFGTKDDVVTEETIRATYQKSAHPKKLHELESDHDYRNDQDVINEVNVVTAKFLSQF